MKKDFAFILQIMNGFVKQKNIQNRIALINKCNITGWEIWFQIEFASYLSTHPFVADWERESRFNIDKRKDKKKTKIAVDFLVRQKNFSKNTFIALELKQHVCIETCIANMLDDIRKVQKARGKETYFRSFWNIGIHPRDTKTNIKAKIFKKMEQKNVNLSLDFIEIRYIPNTKFAYTIF